YSHDGHTALHAEPGREYDFPESMIAGLEAEGYLTKAQPVLERQAFARAPENQAIASAPSNKDAQALRAEYEIVVGKKPFMGWQADELRKRIAEANAA
ncbi:MAG: hypothetical protein ABI216_15740, partial [Devosia sp.]